jgi:hypothetical protein
MRGWTVPMIVLLVLAAAAPARAVEEDPRNSGMMLFFQRCQGGGGGADHGLDWDALCRFGMEALGGRSAARDLPDAPAWAEATHEALAGLWPVPPANDVEQLAYDRALKSVDAGVETVQVLVEPYADHESYARVCAAALDLHLYARVLDDAVDEGAGVHRVKALYAQTLVWRASTELALLNPSRRAAVEQIIRETLHANAPRAPGARVPYWGAKNHHLLVGPLMLAPTVAEFREVEDAIALGMWGFQANAEFRDPLTAEDVDALRKFVAGNDHAAAMQLLSDRGWRGLAEIYFVGLMRAVSILGAA